MVKVGFLVGKGGLGGRVPPTLHSTTKALPTIPFLLLSLLSLNLPQPLITPHPTPIRPDPLQEHSLLGLSRLEDFALVLLHRGLLVIVIVCLGRGWD